MEGRPILIIDHDSRFRAFVRHLLERAGFSTREARTGVEGVAAARSARPGLVLLEVCLPDLNGFEVSRQLRDEFGDSLPIVFVSGERKGPLDRAAGLLVGGDDYLVKPVDPDELLARVRRPIARMFAGPVVSGLRNVALTEREREVLQLLVEGLGTKAIAKRLVVSPKTVSSHIQRILAKLGVHTRAEAVAAAYREGVVASAASSMRRDDDVHAHLGAVAAERAATSAAGRPPSGMRSTSRRRRASAGTRH